MNEDRKVIYNNDQSPVTGAVVVPILQAAITGGLFGLTAGVLTLIFQPPHIKVLSAFAGVWVVSTLVFWLSYRGRWQAILERLMGADLNHSGDVGDMPAPVVQQLEPLRVEVTQDAGSRTDYVYLPYPERLPALAAGLLAGRQFSQTAWASGGQLYTRAEFEEIRAELLRRGLAVWVRDGSPKQGVELTAAGRAVMRRLAHPTLPGGHAR